MFGRTETARAGTLFIKLTSWHDLCTESVATVALSNDSHWPRYDVLRLTSCACMHAKKKQAAARADVLDLLRVLRTLSARTHAAPDYAQLCDVVDEVTCCQLARLSSYLRP